MSKQAAGQTTRYLIDPTTNWPQVVLESAGGQATAYTWGAELRGQASGSAGSAHSAPSQALIPLQGHLGTVIAAVDRAAGVVQRYEAGAFGELANAAPQARHQYTGEYWDADARLVYLRARWYDPANGRFLSVDPFKGRPTDPQSLNRHAYAGGDPLNNVDPSGAMTLGEIQSSQSITAMLHVIRTESSRQVRSAAFRRLGQLAQEGVAKLAREVLEEMVEEVLLDGAIDLFDRPVDNVRFDGAQRRVLDFSATARDWVADIEVKYGLPRRGSDAMSRLISQVRSMRRGPNSARVLIIMSDNVSDAAIARLRRSLQGGRAGPVEILHGAQDVTEFFRRFFIR